MFHVKPKNYIKAKSEPDGKFIDGTFEEVKEIMSVIWNPEMYSIELPDGSRIDGDEFLDKYHELSDKFLTDSNDEILIGVN